MAASVQLVSYAAPPNPLAPKDGNQLPAFDSRGLPIQTTTTFVPAPAVMASISPAPLETAITIQNPTLVQTNGYVKDGAFTSPAPVIVAPTPEAERPQWKPNHTSNTRVSTLVRGDTKRVPINLTWSGLNFEVTMPVAANKPCCGEAPAAELAARPRTKRILNDVYGFSRPGSMLAIMGSSGAGKTSLLNCLSGRESGFTGDVLINGRKVDKATQKYTAFVQQADLFYKTLTVREHLLFQAKLRLPSSTPESERIQRVEDVINELGLDKTRDTLIGDVGMGGISGGERRRLSFANEVLLDPSLLFVDEPTSGLDSFMADNVVDILWQLSRAGRTIVCTIHQPSSDVFARFDSLCLLAEGRVTFFGSIGDAIAYFSRMNFVCPAYSNPADFFIKTLSISTDPDKKEQSKQQVKDIISAWSVSAEQKNLATYVARAAAEDSKIVMESKGAIVHTDSAYITDWGTQFSTLISRSFLTSRRDPITTKARLGQTLFISIIIGLIYLRLSEDQKSVQNKLGVVYFMMLNQSMTGVFGVLQTFAAELLIFGREHKSQMYSPSAFFLSKTLCDFPFQVCFPVIFVAIGYWMIGLNDDPARFFTFMLIIVLASNCAYSLGYIIATASPTVQVALAIGPVVLLPFMIFGGFLINLDSIPKYFYWLSYLSFFRYGFEALAVTEFEGVTISCDGYRTSATPTAAEALLPVCKYPDGQAILDQYSFNVDNKWPDIGILITLLVGFRTIAFFFLYRKSQAKIRAEGP